MLLVGAPGAGAAEAVGGALRRIHHGARGGCGGLEGGRESGSFRGVRVEEGAEVVKRRRCVVAQALGVGRDALAALHVGGEDALPKPEALVEGLHRQGVVDKDGVCLRYTAITLSDMIHLDPNIAGTFNVVRSSHIWVRSASAFDEILVRTMRLIVEVDGEASFFALIVNDTELPGSPFSNVFLSTVGSEIVVSSTFKIMSPFLKS